MRKKKKQRKEASTMRKNEAKRSEKSRSLQLAFALTLVSAFALSACAAPAPEEAPAAAPEATVESNCTVENLRLATIRTEEDPTTLGALAFAEAISEATDGMITVDVFPNSQLGSADDIFGGMAGGTTVDMFYEGISLYPTLEGANAFIVMSVPFIWDSYEQMKAVLETDRVQGLMDEAAVATGVRVVATAGDSEPRALSANRAIVTASDMEGLDLRIANAPMPQAFALAVGAKPQVVAFADLYLALRQGVVDGQENGAITMVNQSLMEVQTHFMPTDYIRDVRSWYINDELWGSLCTEHQDAIKAVAEEAGAVTTAEVDKQIVEAYATLEENMEIVDVDVESFRTALEGVFEEFDGDFWPAGLLAEIRQLAQDNS
jgi:TRAP-type C4-dicarboxylate transport system substrate-binding protein